MILLSILAGLGGYGNYYALANSIYGIQIGIIIQGALVILASIPLILFKGRKTRPSYSEWGVRYFTLSFAVRLLSMFGNILVFVVVLLNLMGKIQYF